MNNLEDISPILITGAHRTGSTWIGRMLSLSPEVRYLSEPFNNEDDHPNYGFKMPSSFHYVAEHNETIYKERLTKLLRHEGNANNEPDSWKVKGLLDLIKYPRRTLRSRNRTLIPLMKDPHSFFSAPWLARELDVQVVITIRHPAAFVQSLIAQNWPYDFENLRRQTELMETFSESTRKQIIEFKPEKDPVVESGSLFWKIIYERVRDYQKSYPCWCYIKQEELAQTPVEGFKKLYESLSLNWTDEVAMKIAAHSDEKEDSSLARDAKNTTEGWKTKLSPEQISCVKETTADIWPAYYTEDDWN